MIPGGFAAGAVTSEGGSDASRTQRYATSNPDALSVRREHRSLPVDFTSAQTVGLPPECSERRKWPDLAD